MISNTKNKAFTLIEMIVALGLVVAMLATSGFIFSVASKSMNISGATSDVSDKLRIITDQLDRDFGGLRKDMPIVVRFEQSKFDEDGDSVVELNRFDQIMFFSVAPTHSFRRYIDQKVTTDPDKLSIVGNLVRVQYALSKPLYGATVSPYSDVAAMTGLATPKPQYDRFLTRRQHILTSDPEVADKIAVFPEFDYSSNDPYQIYKIYNSLMPVNLDSIYEHDMYADEVWKSIPADDAGGNNDYKNAILPACFSQCLDVETVDTGIADPAQRFHLLLSDSVSDFKIQFAYYDDSVSVERWLWFPSDDPDLDGNDSDSHFGNSGDPIDSNNKPVMGVFLNVPNDEDEYEEVFTDSNNYRWINLGAQLPKAIKFTFTIHDDNAEFEIGKTFTHIIYIKD